MDYQPRRAAWPSVIAVLALVVLAATLALAAWLALQEDGPLSLLGPPAPAGVLRVGLSTPLTTLDPTHATTTADHTLHAMLYEGVMATGATLAPEPRLTETLAQASPDGLVWTLTCRRNVTFHDGQPFTCRDVQARLESLRADPGALADSDVDPSTLIALLTRIESIETPNEYALNVRLREPFAFFNEALAHPAAVITRGNAGTGPFQLESQAVEAARVVAFDDYWGGPPELESVTLTVVTEQAARMESLGGAFDAVADPPPATVATEDTQLLSAPGAMALYVAVNREVSPLNEPQIRAALGTGIDPVALANQVYTGHAQPAPLFTSPALPGYENLPAPAFESDLRRGRELQATAGLPDGYDADLSVDAALPESEGLAEELRSQLDALYIGGGIEASDAPLVVRAHLSPDAYAALAWLAGAPPPAGRAALRYDNAAFATWMAQASAALTPEAREAALEGAREALLADPPAAYLVAPDVLVAATDEVSGLQVSPLGWMVVTRDTLVLRR